MWRLVVPVLITSCQVSLKPKMGPVMAQVTTTITATRKAIGYPVACAVALAKRENGEPRYGSIMALLLRQPRRFRAIVSGAIR